MCCEWQSECVLGNDNGRRIVYDDGRMMCIV